MHDIGFCIIVDSFLLSNQSYSSLESPRGKLIEVICPTVSVVYHSKTMPQKPLKGFFLQLYTPFVSQTAYTQRNSESIYCGGNRMALTLQRIVASILQSAKLFPQTTQANNKKMSKTQSDGTDALVHSLLLLQSTAQIGCLFSIVFLSSHPFGHLCILCCPAMPKSAYIWSDL